MAGFIRRFTTFPALATITSIEGVNIVDLIPPGVFVGRDVGTVCLIGEWPKGPYDTPTIVEGQQTIQNDFGGFSLAMADPLSFATNPYSNGCASTWLKNKKFRRLVLVRANLQLAATMTITLTGTPDPTTNLITLKAGTRVRNPGTPTEEFALAQDVVWAIGIVIGSGPQAFTLGVPQTQASITAVPVFSTQGNTAAGIASVTQIDATDLLRSDIGAGSANPNHGITVTNPAALTALTSGQIDTAYTNALNATLPGSIAAADNIEFICCARQSDAIRTAMLGNAGSASSIGTGRSTITRATIGSNLTTASGAAAPGVGANRGDRNWYAYPHFQQFITDIATLDPAETISPSTILVGADAALAVVCSNLNPELNPGQSTNDVVSGGLLQFIVDLEPNLTGAGLPTNFTLANYETMKTSGIAGLRRDPRIAEWIFQSGVTSVDPAVFPSLAPIKRRRMADFIQDSLAAVALRHNKKAKTEDREDLVVGEQVDFLELLLARENPARQRIADYSFDSVSGNTDELEGAGVFVNIIDVRMLSSLDHLVLQTTIGETVTVQSEEIIGA